MAESVKQKMLREKDKLVRMYYDSKMSLTDIGKVYGCSRQYVQMIFITLEIKRRNRQEALKQSPKKRKSKFDFRPEHDSFITKNYSKMTDGDIARAISKPVNAVTYRRLIVLGKKKVERKNFTHEEDSYILKNYRRLTDTAIADKLNRSLISITHHRNRILNRPKRSVRPYTEEEDKFIKQKYRVMTDSQIAEVLNRSKASISIHRHEVLGLAKSINRRSKGN
ncbi:MAG: hypothetical protein JSU85_08830 [Candidatus Zixiibacteriota bacterium]|nr:MAG: hypothetical protein JSU85_08830 [candidate division Zixibacteria bacterium]